MSFRYITANTHPDHDTIAHFRKRFLEPLRGLFVQILVIAQAMGVLKIGTVSLDGTKVKLVFDSISGNTEARIQQNQDLRW